MGFNQGFCIDGIEYSFDLEKINKFIEQSWNKQNIDKEIFENFNGNNSLESRSVREFTNNGDSNIDNIRYDLLKIFIVQILTYDDENFDSIDDLAIGTKIAFKTMLNNGFLKETKR